MPIETIEFNGVEYPKFQSEGNAMRWVLPFAQEILKDCKKIVDIGCNRKEWAYPGASAWDMNIEPERSAMNLPYATQWDAIISSHMLEHLEGNWMTCLDYWLTKIKAGGIIFLYLPHKSQEYWLPKNNRKHIHSFSGDEIADYLRSLGHKVMLSGVDFNHSFVVVCEKVDYVDDTEKLFRVARIAEEIMAADEKEVYCKERNLSYIREGNNVIYNEPSCIDTQYRKFDKINTVSVFDKLSFNGDIINSDTKINLSHSLNEEYQRYNGEAKHTGERQLDEWEWINFKLTGKV